MSLKKVPRNLFMFLALLLSPVVCAGKPGLVDARAGNRHTLVAVKVRTVRGERNEDLTQQAQALLDLSESQNYDNHPLALQTAQSDLLEATQNYEQALQRWREVNNPQEEANILIMLGFIEDRKGEWQRSISFLTQAQSLVDENNEPSQMGRIASGLADIFNQSGLPENGLVQYQRALDYYRQTPDERDDALTILALGSTYYLLGNYPEALTHLQQALASVAADSLDAAICHHYIGKVYGSMGEYPVALEHLQSALAIYTRAVNPEEAAQVLGLIGYIYQQQGRLEPARRSYQQSLKTFTRLSDRLNQAAVSYALGRLELKSNHYDAAEDYLRQSIDLTENIRRVSTSSDLTAAFSATIYERYQTYIECLMRQQEAQPSQNLAVRAFETSELARARSLLE